MAHEIQFSSDYLRELEQAIENRLLISNRNASTFADQHDERVAQLMVMPRMGRREAENRYSVPVGKTGYRMVYQVAGNVVRLVGLTNSRQSRSR